MQKKVNGFPNHDTWVVHLYASNEIGIYNAFYLILKEHYERGTLWSSWSEHDLMNLADYLIMDGDIVDTVDLSKVDWNALTLRWMQETRDCKPFEQIKKEAKTLQPQT